MGDAIESWLTTSSSSRQKNSTEAAAAAVANDGRVFQPCSSSVARAHRPRPAVTVQKSTSIG
jgi:hypothetical protein